MLTITEKTKKEKIISPLRIIDCGLTDYIRLLNQQYFLYEKRTQNKIPDTVLITEHTPVITFGTRKNANIILASQDELAEKHIDLVQTKRAGGITAHNPGQLVFYPILNLRQLGLTITEYIRTLEKIGTELLTQLGISAERRNKLPGLWVKYNLQSSITNRQFRKIASIGVRVSKFVTLHGMSINIQNDLAIFDYIVPCGLNGVEITSVLQETGKRHSMCWIRQKLSELLIKHLSIKNPVIPDTHHAIPDTRYKIRKLPPWLRRPLPAGKTFNETENTLSSLGIRTICTNANCPNIGLCWERGAASILILGNICTRNCRFCSVQTGKPNPPDPTEPETIAQFTKKMKLKYLVLTSVNRDDLPDGGASHFSSCIKKVRKDCPDTRFEILTPDFRHCQNKAIEILADALPFVFAHNIETVPSLYKIVRPAGSYKLSLNLLKIAKQSYSHIPTKSSIMLGLGETDNEIVQVLSDLRSVGCDRITIGQYLKPSKNSLDVVEYIPPDKFDLWKQKAINLGFSYVLSEPFARSSFLAGQ